MLSINTNLPSLIAQKSLMNSTKLLNKAVERMSTGFKINHASDNAANYSIVTNMNTKIGAYQVAEDNVAMGLDLVTTASESLDLMNEKLVRLRALAEQAANGTYGEQSLKAINAEANALVDEIVRTRANTEYNGINLFGESKSQFIEDVVKRDTSGMTALASVDKNTAISSGTYSISTAEELAKLAEMTNNGKISGGEFVLANDIDLSKYSSGEGWVPIGTRDKTFQGNFDGNGYVVSNLYINRPNDSYQGLFGCTEGNITIKNIGLKNVNITGDSLVGALSGFCGASSYNAEITNCYSTGIINATNGQIGGLIGAIAGTARNCFSSVEVTANGMHIGGLIGYGYSCKIDDSFATGNVKGDQVVGGLVGNNSWEINNSYATGNVTGNRYVGAITGQASTVQNCYATGNVIGGNSNFNNLFGDAYNSFDQYKDVYYITDGNVPFTYEYSAKDDINSLKINFQIGINASATNQIVIDTKFFIDDISSLKDIGLINNDYLSNIDNYIQKVSEKQTEFGAVQNRLESALDEISTQYDNLVSSRSTLRDADIAQVSSEYIRQQILQQASATLLSTANQTPALALQLL